MDSVINTTVSYIINGVIDRLQYNAGENSGGRISN